MLGNAAVAMWWDIAAEARTEFEDWHSHEHMPERLAIPGFNRGSRWRSSDGGEGCFVLYEADSLATISTGPYLERLNNPTPWSRRIMPLHRNMVRSLCLAESSHGAGLAQALLTVRFSPQAGSDRTLAGWLADSLLPGLPRRKGIVAAHLLKSVQAGAATPSTEQSIRGGDASADWIVLVSGYHAGTVVTLGANELGETALSFRGAKAGSIAQSYTLSYVLGAA